MRPTDGAMLVGGRLGIGVLHQGILREQRQADVGCAGGQPWRFDLVIELRGAHKKESWKEKGRPRFCSGHVSGGSRVRGCMSLFGEEPSTPQAEHRSSRSLP